MTAVNLASRLQHLRDLSQIAGEVMGKTAEPGQVIPPNVVMGGGEQLMPPPGQATDATMAAAMAGAPPPMPPGDPAADGMAPPPPMPPGDPAAAGMPPPGDPATAGMPPPEAGGAPMADPAAGMPPPAGVDPLMELLAINQQVLDEIRQLNKVLIFFAGQVSAGVKPAKAAKEVETLRPEPREQAKAAQVVDEIGAADLPPSAMETLSKTSGLASLVMMRARVFAGKSKNGHPQGA